MTLAVKATPFKTAAKFRVWLLENHAKRAELEMLLYRKHASHRGIGYAEALDEALCFGWIDGVRHAVDADSFRQRFTPRKKDSKWSQVNLRHVRRLRREGRMHAAGLAALRARDPKKDRAYSFESRPKRFAPDLARIFRANAAAWKFFSTRPPGYRRLCTFYVMEARKPETRLRRLANLIALSEQHRPLGILAPPSKKDGKR